MRVVLLRGLDDRGFVFYTNYDGRKGRELVPGAPGALTIHWPDLGAQVRAEGIVERVSAEESDAYFAARPRGHRVGAPHQRIDDAGERARIQLDHPVDDPAKEPHPGALLGGAATQVHPGAEAGGHRPAHQPVALKFRPNPHGIRVLEVPHVSHSVSSEL